MIIVMLFVLGLCLGSFTDASVWRIHEQARPKKKRVAKDADLSIVKGRSMCVHCQHTLAWYDLLPVVSWLSLGGKCRYCRKPIGWECPAVELLTAVLFVISYIYWPVALSGAQVALFGLWLLVVTAFMALAVYDIRWMLLPDRIVYPLIAIAAVFASITLISSHQIGHSAVMLISALIGSAGLFYGLYTVSNGKWIGGGDVKLGLVIGLLLARPTQVFLMLFLASLIGTLIAVPLMIRGKAKHNSKLPFGPLLIVATFIVYLFGAAITTWYSQHLLFV